MLRSRFTVTALTVALLATMSTAGALAAAWSKASTGNGSSNATTLSAPPAAPTFTKGTCNGGNTQYKATVTWMNSPSTFASNTYNVKFGTTSGGPYPTSWGAGTGTSPLISSNNQFATNTNYYVIVQSKVGTSWVTSSAQATMNYSCP